MAQTKEQRKAWDEKNKERRRAKAKERYNKSREDINKHRRARYKKVGEKIARQTREWRAANPGSHVRGRFNMAPSEYVEMLSAQNNLCAICAKPEKCGRRLSVDHNHETGLIRGLLCHACNVGIGFLGDSADRLRQAAKYLESFIDLEPEPQND